MKSDVSYSNISKERKYPYLGIAKAGKVGLTKVVVLFVYKNEGTILVSPHHNVGTHSLEFYEDDYDYFDGVVHLRNDGV